MTESNDSEHPDGLLIDEAAKKSLPRLYAAWQEAWNRWGALGRGGSYTVNHRGEIPNPEQYHPLLVAAVKADAMLKEACRHEFAKPEWEVSGLVGVLRTRINGDFLRDAQLNFTERTAYGGPIKERFVVSTLRVRPATDRSRKGQSTVAPRTTAGSRSPALQKPTYAKRIQFSPERAPTQFTKWAERERRSVGVIIQGKAISAMAKVFGIAPEGPAQKTVIAWCLKLDPKWTTRPGIPPSRRRVSVS
jgi:hypothetical protein